MKHLFIINPLRRSDRTAEYSAEPHHREARGFAMKSGFPMGPGDCANIAREAAQTGQELRIYACGGDGTLNEVVTGTVGFPMLPLPGFAGGSGNDFIRMFDNPEAFTDLNQLLDAREEQLDLIRVNDDYAFNICSVGLDARIARMCPATSGFPCSMASVRTWCPPW